MKEDNKEEPYSKSQFTDTIKRTVFIMIVAIVTMWVLHFPLWALIVAVLGAIAVIGHSLFWIRKIENKESQENQN